MALCRPGNSKRRWAGLPLALLLGILPTLLLGCGRHAGGRTESQLLAAVIDYDPGRSAEWSGTPQLAVYEDGRFIIRRDEIRSDGVKHGYVTGTLTLDERAEISRRISAVVSSMAGDSRWDVPLTPAEPVTYLVFGGGVRPLQICVSGHWTGGAEESLGTAELKPELLAWLTYATDLRATTRELSPWVPEAMTVRLARTRVGEHAVSWPAAWPAPTPDAVASEMRSEARAPVRSAVAFWTALGAGGEARPIAYDGKVWRAQVFPGFPGADAWRSIVAPAADEPGASDLVVWFEGAPLIAQADRVWIRDQYEPGDRDIAWADADWIRRFAATIAAAPLGRGACCFCIGYRTAFFERAGQPLISVAAIHGKQLRIYAANGKGGGDYRVDDSTWNAVSGLIAAADREGLSRPKLPSPVWTSPHTASGAAR